MRCISGNEIMDQDVRRRNKKRKASMVFPEVNVWNPSANVWYLQDRQCYRAMAEYKNQRKSRCFSVIEYGTLADAANYAIKWKTNRFPRCKLCSRMNPPNSLKPITRLLYLLPLLLRERREFVYYRVEEHGKPLFRVPRPCAERVFLFKIWRKRLADGHELETRTIAKKLIILESSKSGERDSVGKNKREAGRNKRRRKKRTAPKKKKSSLSRMTTKFRRNSHQNNNNNKATPEPTVRSGARSSKKARKQV